jgi:hypothetical protein
VDVQAHLAWTDIATALGTVSATVLAVVLAGREVIDRWIHHPMLDVALENQPPDFQLIALRGLNGSFLCMAWYCRLQIWNNGNRRAHEVQVRMTRLVVIDESRHSQDDRDFVPMNLKWTNIGEVTLAGLAPDLPQHCDLCFFADPNVSPPPLITFCTEVQPNEVAPDRWPNRKPPGNYRAEIAVTATDAQTVYRTLNIEFSGEWFGSVEEMASKRFSVKVTSERIRP